MSFSFVAIGHDGSTLVVNSEDLPTSTSTQIYGPSPAFNFTPAFTVPPTNVSTSQYYPFAVGQDPYQDRRGSYFDSGIQAPARKKRKANVFEEDEATCAKCHYRRKCMKCTNCMARFCEQRCLTRYLDDLAEQEEARLTNNWLCPCCRGIEPVGKYKGSDILRADEKDEDEGEAEQAATPAPAPTPTDQNRPRIVPAHTGESQDSQEPESSPASNSQNHVEISDDDFCAVCGDVYSYDNNDIIFCEGCNVAVHQACYGIHKVPAGDWHCDRCKAKTAPQCNLCGLKGGAMKQLLDLPHNWVHVTCVATLYECSPIELDSKIGPVGLIERIDKRRYKLKCEVCKEKNRKEITGPLIQCVARKCTRAFHPICVQRKLVYSKEMSIFVTHCPLHAPDKSKNK